MLGAIEKNNSVLKGDRSNLLEGNYVIGGKVHLKDGEIKNNPFSRKIGNWTAANWMLQNEKRAKAKIREVMKEQRLGTHEVDECYGYAVYYFIEEEKREFKEDFFGEESSETYNIDIYCTFQLKMIVYKYRNEMKNRLKHTIHLIDTDKDDSDNMPKKCISYNVLTNDSSKEDGKSREYSYNEVIEYEELQGILDEELPKYDEYFELVGFTEFSFRDYVYHMFLSDRIRDLEKNGNQLDEKSLKTISKDIGISSSALKKTNKIVKNLMRTRNDLFADVPTLIGRLLEGKNTGWKPKFESK